MLKEIQNQLISKSWKATNPDDNWIIAYPPHNQELTYLITIVSDFPQPLTPPQDYIRTSKSQIHSLVICPHGVSSKHLNQKHKTGVQFWFWDITNGNIFPSPPNKHREHIDIIIHSLVANSIDRENNFESHVKVNMSNTYLQKGVELTHIIIAINILVFLIMTLAGGTQNPHTLSLFGAKVNSLIDQGQIWRLFTSMFIHIGIIHLGFNLYALWILGRLYEQLFGKLKFIIIYVSSGIGGAFLSYLYSPAISAGASGAIFGILGSLLINSFENRQLWQTGLTGNLVAVIVANFIFGLIQPGIDNYAHLGGLIFGIVTSFFIYDFKALPDLHKLTSKTIEFFKGLRRN